MSLAISNKDSCRKLEQDICSIQNYIDKIKQKRHIEHKQHALKSKYKQKPIFSQELEESYENDAQKLAIEYRLKMKALKEKYKQESSRQYVNSFTVKNNQERDRKVKENRNKVWEESD